MHEILRDTSEDAREGRMWHSLNCENELNLSLWRKTQRTLDKVVLKKIDVLTIMLFLC